MPPSISAIERNNPPPRRKSCSACIKAKRRCTQESPACQRCTQRSIACQYSEGRTVKRPLPPRTPSAPSRSLTGPPSALPIPGPAWDVSVWEHLSVHPGPPELVDPRSILLDASDVLDLFNFNDLDPILEGPNVVANGPVQSPQGISSQPPEFDTGTTRIINDLIIPSPPASLPQTAAVAWAFKIRLNYALDKIRDAPRQMVCESQTPWSHPCLYEHSMPQSMQDAYSSCALHLSRNPLNTEIITRNIESRITTLLSTRLPLSSPVDLLARAQSLLLYQILRVLDNSYQSFSLINDTAAALEEAAFALMSHITFEEETFDLPFQPPAPQQPQSKSDEILLPLHPLSTTRHFWSTWIFQESARRTFLIVFFFMQIYRLLKGEVPMKCDGSLGINSSFTLGEGVWKARDVLTFGIEWGRGRRWAVRNVNFRDVLGKAKGEDVDVFSKMVLSSFWGIDETRGWLMSVGGDL